ncbi:MAG: HAMP domain-containing histidine kinase [Magnetospirillum gryphiswaldense]|nr:HAMP domain-containing histidine kinase [Magnetospirillum gryphiswaldense]
MATLTKRLRRLNQSFAAKLAVAALLFAVAPILVYQRLAAAEDQRNALLLRLAQEQGRLAGEAVLPLLDSFTVRTASVLEPALRRLTGDGLGLKVLFRPKGSADFLFIASAPESDPRDAQALMGQLVSAGVLDRLTQSCQGASPAALRLPRPGGEDEFLTQVSSRAVNSGCWAVLTVQDTAALPRGLAGEPFWRTPQVQAAAAIYVILAVLVLSLFTDVWRGLRHFRQAARRQLAGEGQASFARQNSLTELAEVAVGIDTLLAARRQAEALLRQVSEENAHALKGPLAVIAQSLEPVRRAVPADNARAGRALDIIAASVEKLDSLVSAARRVDRAIAQVMERPRRPVDWSRLMDTVCHGTARLAEERGLRLETAITPEITVLGSAEMLETQAENLLDNAMDFAPAGSAVEVRLERRGHNACLVVRDHGPGIDPDRLEAVFERHLSSRDGDGSHYGLGLWVVRRNAEAMGGRAWAENHGSGGLVVSVEIPLGSSPG